MRGGARQGVRRWTTATLFAVVAALIVVCPFSRLARAQGHGASVGHDQTAPVVVDVRDLPDSIREEIEATTKRLDELRSRAIDVRVIPDVPIPPDVPRVMIISDGVDSTVLEDSIYATEIHADAGGVMIVNEKGQRFRIVGLTHATTRPPGVYIEPGESRAAIFHLFSDVITIDEDEVIDGDVISIFGGHIEVLGRVNGAVVSVFGTIDVEGVVEQSAVAPFGTIHIGPQATVETDVVASEINKEPGGRIGGIRNELFFKLFGEDWRPSGGNWARQTFTAIVLLKVLFWIFLVLIAYALAAKNVGKVKTRIEQSFVKSFLLGILVQILFIPAIAILLVTIIGIPVAIFLVPLLVVAGLVLAHAAIGLFIGEKISINTGMFTGAPLAQTIVGLMALQAIPILAVASMWLTAVDSVSSVFRLVSFALIGLAMVIGYVVVTVGTGAVVSTRFGRRPKDAEPELPIEHESTPGAAEASSPTPLPHRSGEEPGPAPAR